MTLRNILRGLCIAALMPVNAIAQDIDLGEATLEDLLNVKTSVATKKETSARATPGIVTIITEDEIRNLGARDLIDVLSLVPGVTFGNDVQGVVGMGMRGMWAHEGKFLFIVDGVELNEIQYGTIQFGNEFPIHQISRVEIIRGPGSATYGGFAELAVVNIITKKGGDLKGAVGDIQLGRMDKGSQRENYGLQAGHKTGDWEYSVAGSFGKARRGEGVYTGFDGTSATGSYDYKDADEIKPTYANLGLSNQDFKFRFIYDNYKLTTRSMFGFTGLDVAIPNEFRNYGVYASYDLKLSEKLKIVPQVQYSQQAPWLQDSDEALSVFKISEIKSERWKSDLIAHYDVSEKFNLLLGAEYIDDNHKIVNQRDTGGDLTFRSGRSREAFNSAAFFAQGIYSFDFADLTVGARSEFPSFTDSSFVPRLGLTRAEKNWHAKFLYAQAFRTPVLFNLDAKPSIQPEKTETVEVEYGHSVTSNSYITANVFNTKIKDPIVYFFDTLNNSDEYDNFGEVGTRGLELDYRMKPKWGQIQVAYSYNEVNNNNVAKYTVPDEDKALIGMPQHKAVLNGWYHLGSAQLKLNPSLIFIGDRYGYEYDSNANAMAVRKTSGTALVNLNLQKEDLLLEGLSLGLGVFNIFNQDVRYIQPYDGGHSPAPGPSREVVSRVEYKCDF